MAFSGTRAFLRSDGLKIGTAIFEFDTPGIGHILRAGGVEFAFLDMEHSGLGMDAMKRLMRYCEAAGLQILVRPPSKATHHVCRVLDMGAGGVILPMVGSAEEARSIAQSMKYVPDGNRGVALGIAHDRYAPGPVADKLAEANRSTAMIALIETTDGVRNAAEIAAVPEVDVLWIGHFDLSCSLGIPGQFDHPRFQQAVADVIDAAKHHGKALGRLTASVDEGADLAAQGFDVICYSGDIWLLQSALAGAVAALRKATS